MTANDDQYLSRRLKELIETTGGVDEAIGVLVAEEAVTKRAAESLACGLDILPRRYQRNAGTLGCQGQKKILQSKVLIAGLGGLGGHVVEQLVRCGTGVVIGVDADRFEETNLNRQLLADLGSIGLNKAAVAKQRVAEINDAVEFHPRPCRVEDLEDAAYDDVDLIFDCLDKVSSKLHLQDVGERLAIPIVHGAIGGWYGQTAIVWPGSRLLSAIYGAKREGIEKELGNPPFTPALIATVMATEGIKLLLGKKHGDDRVFFVDLLNNQWEYVAF